MTTHLTTAPADSVVSVDRPLGAFENLFDLYTRTLPVQFSVVAELDRVVDPADLETALERMQQAQPVLSAFVDRSTGESRFVRTSRRIPLVIPPSGTPWDVVAANEQAWPIDVNQAPLARCTLVRSSASSSTIVMTFSHQIADGLSAAATVRDLVRAVNGHALQSNGFPPAQEDMLAAMAASAASSTGSEDRTSAGLLAPLADPRMDRRGVVRPFDASAPHIDTEVWSAELTRRARARAHAKGTTVHGLVTAAAVRVLFAISSRDFVSVINPMDTRRATGAGEVLALYFMSTRLGIAREQSTALWPLARDVHALVHAAQDPQRLVAAASEMSGGADFIRTPADATEAMVSFANYDLMVTNLGALDRSVGSASADDARIVDLFGPVMATQIRGERILAVSSFDGRMRTTLTTREPLERFLVRVREEVENALAVDPSDYAGY